VERVPETLGGRVAHIASEIASGYRVSGWLLVAGLIAVVVVIVLRARRAWILAASLIPIVAFSLHDFQGTADAYPLLPYAAVGIAGACALLPGRLRAVIGGIAVLGILAMSFTIFSGHRARDTGLLRERDRAAAVERLLNPGEHFEALGDPLSLVLTGTRGPTRFVYLSEGVGDWAVRHEFGDFEGFVGGIRARRPAVVVVDAWTGPLAERTERWLTARYVPGCLGDWLLFLAPGVRERAALRGVPLERAVRLSCRSGRGVREHPHRVDAGVDGPGVDERRPALAVAGDVNVEQRLADRTA
jgi:hypothetical protein